MRPKRVSARNLTKRAGWALVVGMVLFAAPPLAGQSEKMNFFVIVRGSSGGANTPAIWATDANCLARSNSTPGLKIWPSGASRLTKPVGCVTGRSHSCNSERLSRRRISSGGLVH